MSRQNKGFDPYRQPGLFDSLVNEPEPSLFSEVKLSPPKDERLRYLSFGSGSSGNCSYIGNEECGFLIDAGVNDERVTQELRKHGIDMRNVLGIIITHDHSDHVAYCYKLLRNNKHLALYCTPKTLNGILRRHSISRRLKEYHHPIYKETPFHIKNFTVTAFEVSHDGTDNSGYIINWGKHNFVVATDMGVIGARADHYIRQATSLMIESDYDEEMLERGHYPMYLKQRIRDEKGHIENSQLAEFLSSMWTPTLTHVFLCHLSANNNTPERAREMALNALVKAGAEKVGDGSESIESRDAPVQLYVLPRYESSHLFFIR